MAVIIQSVVWQACIDEERCISVLGRRYCIRIAACIRILFENNNYFLEIEAFGQRWRWNLTNACHTFYEVGIARFKLCAEPRERGVRLILEGCLGVDSVEKCWTLYAADVTFFRISELARGQAEILGIASEVHMLADQPTLVGFGTMEGPLKDSEIERVLSAPALRD